MLTDELALLRFDGVTTMSPSLTNKIDVDAGDHGEIAVPDAHLMFQGEYRKDGFDLVITDSDTQFTIHDYFRAGTRATLTSPEGAILSADVVAAMAVSDHGIRYAQATQPAAPSPIGRVETVSGQATAIRNGTPVALNQGDFVYKGDVVQTDRGSALGITFIDGTTFSLQASARMVLNEMVYQPGGAQNSALLSIVQGSVTFLAGQVAKTGDLKVGTPVATMGIRGTLVSADVDANNGTTKFSVITESDGRTGRYDLLDRAGNVIASVSSPDRVLTIAPGSPPVEDVKSFAQQQTEQAIVAQVYQLFSLGQANPIIPGAAPPGAPGTEKPAGDTGPKSGPSNGGGSGTDPNQTNASGATPSTGTGSGDPPQARATTGDAIQQAAAAGSSGPSTTTTQQTTTPPPVVIADPSPAKVVAVHIGNAGAPAVAVADDGQPTIVAGTYGTLAIGANGNRVYVPLRTESLPEGQVAPDTFVIDRKDPVTGTITPETITYSLTGENDAPTAASFRTAISLASATGTGTRNVLTDTHAADPDHFGTYDETLLLKVASAQAAADAAPTTVASASPTTLAGQYGHLAIQADGSYSYVADRPAAIPLKQGETQTDAFSVTIVDPHGATAVSVLTFDVTGKNDAPVVTALARAFDQSTGVKTVDLLDGASDPDHGAVLHIDAATLVWANAGGSSHGGLPPGFTLAADGLSIAVDTADASYRTLPLGQTVTQVLTFDVVDEVVGSSQGRTSQTATFTITGSDAPPAFGGGLAFTVDEGGSHTLTRSDLAAIDPDNTDAQLVYTVASQAGYVTVGGATVTSFTQQQVDDGVVAYHHDGSETTSDSIAITLSDGTASAAPSTIAVTVTPLDDPPAFGGDRSITVDEGGVYTLTRGDLAAIDPDNTDAQLTYTASPQHGHFVVGGANVTSFTQQQVDSGQVAYQHDGSETTDDSVTITLGDGAVSASATFTIAVTPVNDPPVAVDDGTHGAIADGPAVAATTRATGVLGNDYDPDPNETASLVVSAGRYSGAGASGGSSSGGSSGGAYSQSLVDGLGGSAGFGENTLPANDDGSSTAIDITSVFGPGGLSLFGTHFTSLYVNNNGNLTFSGPSSTFVPQPIQGTAINPIIAAFWYDVDTRPGSTPVTTTPGGNSTGSDLVYWDLDTTNHVFTATWDDVGYYSGGTDKPNAFQIQLIDRGSGDFDIVYRYESINYGGNPSSSTSGARAGYSGGGSGTNSYELPQSGDPVAMAGLDTMLGNTGAVGVDVFTVRSGTVSGGDVPVANGTATIRGLYGTLLLHDDGTYAYSADHAQSLGAGIHGTDSFTYTVRDPSNAPAQASIVFDVTGVNDAPVVAQALTEAHSRTDAAFTTSLLAGASDADSGDTLGVANITYTVDGIPMAGLAPNGVSVSGTDVTIDPGQISSGGHATVVVGYDIQDGHNGSVHQTETITVTGNHSPTVSGPTTGSGNEGAQTFSVDLLDHALDQDGDALQVANFVWSDTGSSTSLPAGFARSGATITVDPSDVAYDGLASGASYAAHFTYDVVDPSGAVAHQSATITIAGTNDSPTAVSLSNASVAENSPGAVVGTLTTTDPDQGDTFTYGSPSDSRFEVVNRQLKLKAGESLDHETQPTVNLSVTVTDSSSATYAQNFVITVTDVNERPVASASVSGSGTEGSGTFTVDLLQGASDPDGDALHVSNFVWSDTGSSTNLPAGFTRSGATITVDPSSPAYDGLAAGSSSESHFAYDVTDPSGLTSHRTATITIQGANDAPSDIALSNAAVAENSPGAVIGTLTPTDPDQGDAFAYTVSDNRFEAVGGQLRLKAGQSLDHETEPTVNLSVTVTDSGSATYTKVFAITVTDANEAPVATGAPSGSGTEGSGTFTVDLLQGAGDPDGDTLHVKAGTLVRTDGNSSALPPGVSQVGDTLQVDASNAAYNHLSANGAPFTASFGYDVTDPSGLTVHRTASISIAGTNDAPTASTGHVDTNEDTSVAGTLPSATDPDDGDTIAYSVAHDAQHGTVTLTNTATGAFTYVPNADFHGPDTFHYTVTDSAGASSTYTETVTIASVNDAPTASNDTLAQIAEDSGPYTIAFSALTANDRAGPTEIGANNSGANEGGQTITVTSVGNATGGTVAIQNGAVVFTPTPNYNGSASFNYTITDNGTTNGSADPKSATATASFQITPVNDPPSFGGDRAFTVAEGGTYTLTTADLAATDPDNGPSQITYTVSPAHGFFTLGSASVTSFTQADVANGQVAYHHDGSEGTSDAFSIGLSDGAGGSTSGSFTIGVTPVNDAPTAFAPAAHYQATERTPLTLSGTGLQIGDVDGNGGVETVTLSVGEGTITVSPGSNQVTLAGNGTSTVTISAGVDGNNSFIGALLAGNNGGSVTYLDGSNTPSASTTLTLAINDGAHSGAGGARSATATATIDITPVNDAPSFGGDRAISATQGGAYTLTTADLAATDPDNSDAQLTYTVSPTHGSFAIGSQTVTSFTQADVDTGLVTYQHDGSATTDDSFTIALADGAGGNASASFAIAITGVNHAPVATSARAIGPDDLVGISIPVGSNDAGSYPVYDNTWSVSAPPFPINDHLGIGYLINPSYQTHLSASEFVLHDHVYVAPNVPDPTRAVITFQFATPTVINDLNVIEHDNGVTKLHAYAGNSLGSLTDIGSVFGTLGDLVGPQQMYNGEVNDFHFANAVAATFFQVVIEKTSLDSGYALFRMFPGGYVPTSGATADVTEDSGVDGSGNLAATGTIVFTDPDLSDVHLVSATGAPIGTTLGSLTASKDFDTTGSGTGGQLTWTYTVANTATQYLAAGQTKVDSFNLTIDDQHGGVVTERVDVVVTGANDAPIASNASYANAVEDAPYQGTLPVASDPDQGDTVTYGLGAGPAHGTVAVGPSGSFTYTPAADFNGADSFTYTVSDGHAGGTNTYTANLSVAAVNDAPVFGGDQAFTVQQGGAYTLTRADLAAVDPDNSDAQLTYTVSPNHGTFVVGSATVTSFTQQQVDSGLVTYRHDGNGRANDTVIISLSDGTSGVNSAIAVTVADNPPVASNVSYTNAVEDTAYSGTLPAASDLDQGDSVTYGLGTGAAHGTVVVGASGSFTYTPTANFNGADSFTYTVSDGQPGGSNTYTASLTVAAVNDAPIASNDTLASIAQYSGPYTVQFSSLTANDSPGPANEAGQTLAVTAVGSAVGGMVAIQNGAVVFTPASNYSGPASFAYTVTDNGTTNGAADPKSATATASFQITANRPPAITSTAASLFDTESNAPIVHSGAVTFSDPDQGDSATASVGAITFELTNSAGTTIAQYASSVLGFSSQYSPNSWSAAQALGAPNTNSYGDISTAYAPTHRGGALEDLTLGFGQPMHSTGASIRETDGNGFVYQIDAIDTSGVAHTVWSGADPTLPGTPGTFEATWARTPYLTAGLKIYIDTDHSGDWEEIDSVLLRDGSGLSAAAAGALGNAFTVQQGGAWAYNLASPDYLAAGETLTATYATVATDSHGAIATQNQVFHITGTNDAPVASNASYANAVEDTPYLGTLPAASDAEGDTVTYGLGSGPAHGTVSIAGSGSFTYTPATNFNGADSFTYTVSDGHQAGTTTYTASLTVAARNDPPTGADVAFETPAGTAYSASLPANDPDGDPIAYAVSAPSHGSASVDGSGTFTYLPDAAYAGPDSFTYTVSDPSAAYNTYTVSVGVIRTDGSSGDDLLYGTNSAETMHGYAGKDSFVGRGGNDTLDGGPGIDLAAYDSAAEAIAVDLAAGTVTGGPSTGTDTLVSIERVRGTAFADTYVATGFLSPDDEAPGTARTFNEFEGMGGDDTITGNGNTRISYEHANAAVTVDLSAGTAHGTAAQDAAGIGTDTIVGGVTAVRGSANDDTLTGSDTTDYRIGESFEGLAGDDFIDGKGGYDRAVYSSVGTGALGIIVQLAAGTVTGRDAAATAVVGTDTLRGIEQISGTNSADIYDATGFSATATAALPNASSDGTPFNEFEGYGGDDQIIGNGTTRISYLHAAGGVTVDLAAGTASGTAPGDVAGVGADTFSGVYSVRGSTFDDILRGSNATAYTEWFEGRAGDDFIDGRGGYDRARYDNDATGSDGVLVNLAQGTVTGTTAAATAIVGHDTLRSIEAILGSFGNDVYNASGYTSTSSLSAGQTVNDQGNFNEFEGVGGDDTITGNGNTRISYSRAFAGVTVDLAAGTAHGTAAGDLAIVGTDTITGGVNGVFGSNYADTLLGSNNASGTTESFSGFRGDDTIDGRGGFDLVRYDGDTVGTLGIQVTASSGTFTVTGRDATALASIGTDTLSHVEAIRGTAANDIYDASGWNGASTDTGLLSGFNQFDGRGGDDDITGNGYTTLLYSSATAGVTVRLGTASQAGSATGAGIGADTIHGGVSTVIGSGYDDTFYGTAANERFDGGTAGFDRVRYDNVTIASGGLGISVSLAAGTVTGRDAAATALIGADTLRGVEAVTGTNAVDVFNAVGFTASSANNGGADHGSYNDFEGYGGDDTITGNGFTRISYRHAAAGVTVDLTAGTGQSTAAGDAAGVGIDHFTGVNEIRGSEFADILYGSDITTRNEYFEGRGGNDTFDGRGGYDLGRYVNAAVGSVGIQVNLANGTVTSSDATTFASVGSDTLLHVEGIVGTTVGDTYDARGFSATSTNAGSYGSGNSFVGEGGDDDVFGNGFTTVDYGDASAAVTVDLGIGAHGTAAGDIAQVGTDTFHGGVNGVYGSNYGDVLYGTSTVGVYEFFNGLGGNDVIFAGGGSNLVYGGAGDDTISAGSGTDVAGFYGLRTNYNVTDNGGGSFTVAQNAAGFDGTDTLTGIEVLYFSGIGSGGTYYMYATTADLSLFPLNGSDPLIGTAADDHLTVSSNVFSHLIDLGAGANDRVTLSPTNGATSYYVSLNLQNVEFVDTTGAANESVAFTSAVNGLSVDLGAGSADVVNLYSPPSGTLTNVVSLQNVETVYGGASNDIVTFDADGGTNQALFLGAGQNVVNLAGNGTSFHLTISSLISATDSLAVNGRAVADDLSLNQTVGAFFDTSTNTWYTPTYDLGGGNDTLHLYNDTSINHFGNYVTVKNIETIFGSDNVDRIQVADTNAAAVTTITPGLGRDMVLLGAGSETIRFDTLADAPWQAAGTPLPLDTVVNFDAAHDALSFKQSLLGQGTLTFRDSSAFTGTGGAEIRIAGVDTVNHNYLLDVDVNGDGVMNASDMEIQVNSVTGTLHASNFLIHA